MNRNLILLMLLVLFPIGLSAEGFVSERVFVYPVKSYYQIGDSVEVKGHVLSEDSTFVPHSRYLYLDVIHGDSLVYKQHLRCDDSGLSIPVFMFLLLGRRMSIISVLIPASCGTIHRGVSR